MFDSALVLAFLVLVSVRYRASLPATSRTDKDLLRTPEP